MTPQTMAYLLGIFVAAMFTAIAPYIRKFGTEFSEWDNAYTLTFLVSYVVAMLATLIIYDMNPLDVVIVDRFDAFVKGVVLGFLNPVVTEVSKHIMPKLFNGETG